MIHLSTGELFYSPIPLELSLNRCSYGCAYCFATLNYRHTHFTQMKPTHLFSFLSHLHDRDTLPAKLLRDGSAVTISNHTDPFCPANRPVMRAVLEVFQAMNIPVSIQTKGGATADDLAMIAPSCWYVTITTDQDAIRQRIEPHAPTIAARLALIDTLLERGDVVTIGMNPYVAEWWQDFPAFCRDMKQRGVHGAALELLHLNYRQRDHMTADEREALGADVITTAMKRKYTPAVRDAFLTARRVAIDAGLSFSGGDSVEYDTNDHFAPFYRMYRTTYPNLQQWVNALVAEGRTPEQELTEADFVNFFAPQLPTGRWGDVQSHLGSMNRDAFRVMKIPRQLTYRELLSIIWRNPSLGLHPTQSGAFALRSADNGDVRAAFYRGGRPGVAL